VAILDEVFAAIAIKPMLNKTLKKRHELFESYFARSV
jgi:hypothetical protein